MGQSASTARNPPDTGYPNYLTPNSIERDSGTRDEEMSHRQENEQNGEAGSSSGMDTQPPNGQYATSGQPHEPPESWQQPRRLSTGFPRQMRSIEEEEGLEYELPSREIRQAAIARMARRQSTMSRLGSRLLPNSVIRGLLNSQEETPAEGHAHRHGLVSRTPPRSETAHSSSRFSPFSVLGSTGITRRRPARVPYFIPSRADSSDMPDPATESFADSSAQGLPEPSRASWRRSARLHRMRHSLSTPISHMFGQPQSAMPTPHEGMSHRASGPPFDDSLPTAMDTRLDFGEPLPELDSVEPGVQSSNQPSPGLMGMRRLPSLLRARSARALRREEQTPLSRVLQLAAAAIAAQLSGTTGPALPNIQALGNDGLEGSLENFIQSLQHATSAQAQPTAPGEAPSNSGNEGPSPPVNFLRVFRFANSESPFGPNPSNPSNRSGPSTNSSENQSAPSDGMSVDEPSEGSEGRTVTLVVVGVRSVPAGNGGNGEQGPPGPGGAGLDALLGLPFLPSNAIPRPPGAAGDLAQRADGSSRLNALRSAGPNGLPSSGAPELLRQPAPNSSRRMSDAGPRPAYPSYPPSVLSESPPGPHPPPSTPAEQGMSAVSSGTSTPSRRPSSASAMSPGVLPHLHEGRSLQSTVEPAVDEPVPPNAARQRRRSDSEFARHRALGSGSVRRNGMVEPDQPPPGGGRSWLIYVVGTNLSENHPALTTPSLFTDVGTPSLGSNEIY